jgi:diketogulonate reductase-like aldo/keto reductase
VKRIGVSNFYASHLTKLFDVCQEFNLEKPFANEVQINPYVYCLEKKTLDLCFQNNVQLIAYSPLGFNVAPIVLQDTKMQSIAEEILQRNYRLHGYFQRESASFPKATTYNGRKKTLLPRTLSIMSCTFLMTWTRSQKVKIPPSSLSIMLKNPRKTPTGCTC